MGEFFSIIKKSGLTLKIEKCRFAQPKVPFLGHIVGSGMITPDPVKTAYVQNIQPSKSKKEVKRILGFFSYFQSFLPQCAHLSYPLAELTKKDMLNIINWGPLHQTALDNLIKELSQATSLNTIDFERKFGLTTDASALSVGCCLFQWNDKGDEIPVAFASSKLSATQTKWSTIEREAYAVIWALGKFRSWILLSEILLL